MPQPTDLTQDLVAELRKSLGASFAVVDRPGDPELSGISLAGDPDIVVHDKARGRWILVEIKGSGTDAALPLAMLPAMKDIQARNSALNPNMVLVSTSPVPTSYKGYFASSGIQVLEGARVDAVAPGLVGLIKGPV